MARPTRAEQEAKKAADAARIEQALTESRRIVTPWFKREMKKAKKRQAHLDYLAVKEQKRLDAIVENAAGFLGIINRHQDAQWNRAQELEIERSKQARLAELRAGAQWTMDDTFMWDPERQMEKRTPEWEQAVALDREREQAERLGPDTVDRDAARAEMTEELQNRDAERDYGEFLARQVAEEFEKKGGYMGNQDMLSPEDYKRRQWAINKFRQRLREAAKKRGKSSS